MNLLVNDLSLAGQFPDVNTFLPAIGRVMRMRQLAKRFGHVLYCHSNLANAQITPMLAMHEVAYMLSADERRALLQWMTTEGPFWNDTQVHGGNDYLECNGEIVTDTAVGEAAYCCFIGILRSLVSFTPSSWEISLCRSHGYLMTVGSKISRCLITGSLQDSRVPSNQLRHRLDRGISWRKPQEDISLL